MTCLYNSVSINCCQALPWCLRSINLATVLKNSFRFPLRGSRSEDETKESRSEAPTCWFCIKIFHWSYTHTNTQMKGLIRSGTCTHTHTHTRVRSQDAVVICILLVRWQIESISLLCFHQQKWNMSCSFISQPVYSLQATSLSSSLFKNRRPL